MLRWGKLEIGWGFPVLAAVSMLAGAEKALPIAVLSALSHETGHLLALRITGTRVERVRLTAFGAEIRADTRYLPYPLEIFCVLAGPAVNLVLAVFLARVLGNDLGAGVNLVLGAFNLLPVPALDGGRILHLLVSWVWDPITADRVCRWAGLLCSLALTAAALAATVCCHAGLFLLISTAGTLFPQLLPERRKERKASGMPPQASTSRLTSRKARQ